MEAEMGNEQNNQPPHHPQAERFAKLFKDAIIADPDSMSPLQESLVNFVGEFTDKVCRHFGFDVMDGSVSEIETGFYDHDGALTLVGTNTEYGKPLPKLRMSLNEEILKQVWNLESKRDQTDKLQQMVRILVTIAHEFSHIDDLLNHPEQFVMTGLMPDNDAAYIMDTGERKARLKSLELVDDEVVDNLKNVLALDSANSDKIKEELKKRKDNLDKLEMLSNEKYNPIRGLILSEYLDKNDRDLNG